MPRHLFDSMARAAFDLNRAAADTAVTVAARMPILAEHLLSPSPGGLAEWQTAYSEKVLAFWQGQAAGVAAFQAAAWRSIFSPVTPMGLAQNTVTVMRAMSRPAHRAVRANADRLGGPR